MLSENKKGFEMKGLFTCYMIIIYSRRKQGDEDDDDVSIGKLTINDASTITDYSDFKLPRIESAEKSITG
jgi:hypothetical protein